MHAPFLSCCELWYGTNRICYDFVLREAWHPDILLTKMLKSKVSQWLWIPTKAIWHDIQNHWGTFDFSILKLKSPDVKSLLE